MIEACETFHVHYRNLRIALSLPDFINFSEGVRDSYDRWVKRGKPYPRSGQHIELCRKAVATTEVEPPNVRVNFNKNLYVQNEGRVFSEGADFHDDNYIHLKIRDMRFEMSIDEFKVLAEAVREANECLDKA